MELTLDGGALSWAAMAAAVRGAIQVRIGATARERLQRAAACVAAHVADEAPIYSINTGFGIFARTRIAPEKLGELQYNLVRSHAAGVGPALPAGVVRAMLLLKLQTLCLGHSGVRSIVAETLAAWLNADLLPMIPAQGSVGASGDLAPLAHLALALLGEGEVLVNGETRPAGPELAARRIAPLTLAPKEGLALLNGTQAMAAVASAALDVASRTLRHADLAGALTIEGMFGSVAPFDARLHQVRPHPGAQVSATAVRALLAESAIVASHRHCQRVQDPYALRCLPAVHGTVREAVEWAQAIVVREANSVTDNPIVFPDDNAILSGGNFHGAPLSLACDLLAIALTTLASISERRIEQLTNPKAGELPVMGLTPTPGLHSGFMVAHTTAASLVSECKTLAHPASVDTIPTWAGQEDHVSMGMWAARKALQVAEMARQVVGIELLAAAQAMDLHPTRLEAGRGTREIYRALRARIPMLTTDRYLAPDLQAMNAVIESETLLTSLHSLPDLPPEW